MKHDTNTDQKPEDTSQFIDPVCGMKTGDENEFIKYEHEGLPYYFCSEYCLNRFIDKPEKYLYAVREDHNHARLSEMVPPSADGSALYTCPMHPEIRQNSAGSCPKCGMALEPVMPVEEEDNEEY
ncbi:MAG: heavy metal-binding domain-containing protein [Thermodesulfobacteriota bacterium]|nr:heavy metal-binding domain-containing protein [Thermodesulfobacteriota bacterium]